MMRAVALFAVLAVASAAGRNRLKNKFQYPDASQYTLDGAETVTPGGSFQVQGILDMDALNGTAPNPAVQYCPSDAQLIGKTVVFLQLDTHTADWVIQLLDDGAVKKYMGSSPFHYLIDQETVTFTVQQNGYSWFVKFNPSEELSEMTTILLNRGHGLGNCHESYYPFQGGDSSLNKFVFWPNTYAVDSSEEIVGLSDFTVQQTSQGGFRIDGAISFYEEGLNANDIDAFAVNTFKYGNTGSVCNFTDPEDGDFESDGITQRPKKKYQKNPNGAPRCPSFLALAGSGFFNTSLGFEEGTDTTFYGFRLVQPITNYRGVRTHRPFYVLITQINREQDYWVVYVIGEDIKFFLAQRTGLVESEITAQHLKHKETRNAMKWKQAQSSSGFFVKDSENFKKASKTVSSSFENDFKKNKPRSWKKRTKNKDVNRKRARKARKARRKERVSVTP